MIAAIPTKPITVKILGPNGKWITAKGKTVIEAIGKAINKKVRVAAAGKS